MLTIKIDQIPLASYALLHNGVALIRNLTIENSSESGYDALKVRIFFDPEFADMHEEHIVNLPSRGKWSRSDIQPSINTSYLSNLTEAVTAKTTVQVLTQEGEMLAEAKQELQVLDYCQYWGNAFMPQYLAAYVTPRHIALDQIIKRASELLNEWTGTSLLSGYSHDVPNRPKLMVGALYEAIAEQKITYCYPTMTLAKHGQKIRTCEELLSAERGKRGCCLDMALLMCSCMEAIGLHPLLIMQDEHAFAGCWLVDEMFTDSVNDDPTVLTKRTAEGINEIILVETTAANEGQKTPFDKAVISANNSLKSVEKFSFVVDIARARLAGVKPIPQRIYNGNEYVVENKMPEEESHLLPGDMGETFSFKKDENEVSRFDLWERRLLDLSTRNRLLNIRFTESTLRIMVPTLADIVQSLGAMRQIVIAPRPVDWENPISSRDLGERIGDDDPIRELLQMGLVNNDVLYSFQDERVLSKAVTTLYRASRLAIEESGANTLYVALGFLKWYEQGKTSPYFAPIVLYPVRLERMPGFNYYYMIGRGEDPLLNETLFEFLKQNYEIEIPDITSAINNEAGLDIKYILAAVRKAVMGQDKWDVIEESTLGTFDFNRFVIWNDIRSHRVRMSEHPLISSLVQGRLCEGIDDAEEVTSELPSKDVALPISADSSQLAAIYESISGKSFVLHGPPGTGKSQTITNIISNALFHGKRVLFVAEKMAALEVVQRRLAAIGLDPFCLELHSNKTKKSLVMDQLRKTTEVAQLAGDGTFEKEAAYLDELKSELNSHVERLHKVYPSGLSIYDCFARYSAIELPESALFRVDDEYIKALTPEIMRDDTALAQNFESVAVVVADHNNALHEIGLLEYSPDIRTNIKQNIFELEPAIANVDSLSKRLCTLFNYPVKSMPKGCYVALCDVAKFVLDEEMPTQLIDGLNDDVVKHLKELGELTHSSEMLRSELLARYNEHIFEVDHAALRRCWMESEKKWFLPKFFDRRSVKGALSSYVINGADVNEFEVVPLLDKVAELSRLQGEREEVLNYLDRVCNVKRELKGVESARIISYRERLSKLLAASLLLKQGETSILKGLAALLNGGWLSFRSQHSTAIVEYVNAYSGLAIKVEEIERIAAASLAPSSQNWLADLDEIVKRWKLNLENLRSKVAYNVVRKQVYDRGLASIAEAFESGVIGRNDIDEVYLKSLYKSCANYYISQDKELSFFQSILFEDKIKRFRTLCKDFEDITRRELQVRMTAMLPALRKEASQSSDVGYLQRCIRNGCRGVSIRKLFETIPDLISRMCPAMLMSPLSVSQYLGQDWPEFDLVIFDEASQMPTCEAVAAIARGKSAIIVGDEHQLPPTSFFMADNFSEQHSESEDLESILEDCLALSMPQKYLLWHYRSKHESLITFSNRHFYKNSLMTFPSNDDMATKVSFEYVNGLYERGGAKNNKAEATAIVNEIKMRLSNPKSAMQSIGVVTFNVNQQSLIEDMLNDMLRKNSNLEVVAAQMHEPIFIKNLENVQGDERDVILFSVGYGRDKAGKVTMNFGPLNRDGGERRLNVAVSRARYEMKIFSSLRAEDIDLYRSNAKGVQYLKSFLEYAERGKVALMHMEEGGKEKAKDHFVESVAEALRAKGLRVNTNIGSSEYRVDIGIVDPKNPQRYLLGLLCDGYNYVASHTAHDRDVTTPTVLSLLGWKTYNIWSVEWWDTPSHVLKGILREVERISSCEDAEEETEEADSEVGGVNDAEQMDEVETHDELAKEVVVVPDSAAKEYNMANLPVRVADSALFSQGYYTSSVESDIRKVVDAEAPISRRLLVKRLLASYSISRNGIRINAYLTEMFEDMGLVTSGTEDIFVWRDNEQKENYSGYRLASDREALDIAPEEVAQAVVQVLKEQFAIGEEGLIREAARSFGYAVVRENITASMRRGIEYAMSQGMIILDDGRYRVA